MTSMVGKHTAWELKNFSYKLSQTGSQHKLHAHRLANHAALCQVHRSDLCTVQWITKICELKLSLQKLLLANCIVFLNLECAQLLHS